jgi:hypothetical protein
MKAQLLSYLKSNEHYWWTVSVLPGLYSLFYLYKNNYTLVNSVDQVLGLSAFFIAVPSIFLMITDAVFKRFLSQHRPKLYYTFLLISTASFISLIVFMGWRWKALVLFAALVVVSSFFVARHYKKVVLFLVFMTVIAGLQLAYFYTTQILPQPHWVKPQGFEQVTFTKKPNIYLIQPDGYVGKKALEKAPYGLNNQRFYTDLNHLGFRFQDDYRSNYSSTLTSNSALFTGQHHYLNGGHHPGEMYNARNIIAGSNPVIRTLKNNGYETRLLTETTYFLTNFPEVAYNDTNITSSDLSYFPYFKQDLDYEQSLTASLGSSSKKPRFTFIQLLQPAHISVTASQSLGKEQERESYLIKIPDVNIKLIALINQITEKDPEGIIIIAADHGGFVGLNYTKETEESILTDTSIKSSIFSALFAIKAPLNFNAYLDQIDSAVEVFPMLFAYLSDKKTINNPDNGSYIEVSQGAEKGVYQYFNNEGKSVFKLLKDPNKN